MIYTVWLLSGSFRAVEILVIMITLLVMAVGVPTDPLELCCMLMMSPLVCSGSWRRKIFRTVACGTKRQ